MIKNNNTTIVNISNGVECDVYIGRGSKWGNPFKIGKDGTRDEVIRKFHEFILTNEYLLNHLHELQGKKLGCFCKPLACHGDILIELIEERCKSQ